MKKRRLAILGSTGSIGRQTLDVVSQHPDLFEVELLTANTSSDLLVEQAVRFNANSVVIRDESKYREVADALEPHYIKVFTAMILPLAVQYPLVDETTALGHVRLALFCSLFRKTVFLACLLLLPALVSAEATFLSEPIADVVAATVTTILFLRFFPRILAERSGTPASQ